MIASRACSNTTFKSLCSSTKTAAACQAEISIDCLLSSLRSSLPSPLPATLTLSILDVGSCLPAFSFVAALPEVGVTAEGAEMDGR